MNSVILKCNPITYYDSSDEEVFFEWLEKISSVKRFWGEHSILYIELKTNILPDEDLKSFLGLFHRYNIGLKQLAPFLTPENKYWFFDNKKNFWYSAVFGKKTSQWPRLDKFSKRLQKRIKKWLP
jgi:hypothetical protein